MKVKVNEEARQKTNLYTYDLVENKLYEVVCKEKMLKTLDAYRIVDESGEDYLYPASLFDIAEE